MEGGVHTQYASFEEEKGIGVANINLSLEDVHRKYGSLWFTAVQEDEEGSFATEIPEQQLEEAVDDKSLARSQYHPVLVQRQSYNIPRIYHGQRQ